ncbi:ParA family protein [Streptomyces olivoreticuli]
MQSEVPETFLPDQRQEVLPSPPVVIAVASQKGGVGKTVTTVNLACRLAMDGANVAVIDLEPQAQAGSALGVELEGELIKRSLGLVLQQTTQNIPGLPAIAEIMFDVTGVLDQYEDTGKLYVIASEESTMTAAQNAFITQPYTATPTLRRLILSQLPGVVDYVLIDTPPAVSSLNALATAAADYVVTLCNPEYQTVKGAFLLKPTVEAIEDLTRGECRPVFLGAILNCSNPESKWTVQDVAIQNQMVQGGLLPFKTDIRRDVRISESYLHQKPVVVRYLNHAPGKLYTSLVEEVLTRIDTVPSDWEVAPALTFEEETIDA